MLLAEYRVSERRACATVFLQRSVYRYLDQPRDDRAVRQRMKEIAETRVRYGFNRIHILLRRVARCSTKTNPGRQRERVHLEGLGPLGLRQQGDAGLLAARKTDGQSLHRVIQWELSR